MNLVFTLLFILLTVPACSTVRPITAARQTEIDKVLTDKHPVFETCYKSNQDPDLPMQAGEITLRFTIVFNGSVKNVEVAHSTLKNGPIEKCITGALEETSFPEGEGMMNADVLHTFHLGEKPADVAPPAKKI